MEHLLAMILTAFDPRVNPVAGLLRRHASHAYEFLVKLTQPADVLLANAENYTKNHKKMHEDHVTGRVERAISRSGRIVCLEEARYT